MSANNLDALLATRSSPSATQGGGPTTRQNLISRRRYVTIH